MHPCISLWCHITVQELSPVEPCNILSNSLSRWGESSLGSLGLPPSTSPLCRPPPSLPPSAPSSASWQSSPHSAGTPSCPFFDILLPTLHFCPAFQPFLAELSSTPLSHSPPLPRTRDGLSLHLWAPHGRRRPPAPLSLPTASSTAPHQATQVSHTSLLHHIC